MSKTREIAKKRVKKKKDFYQHLTSYMVMGVFFFVLNAVTSFGNWWFYWPMLGWGIGLIFHYFETFGVPGVGNFDKDWEERAIQDEMERLEGNRYQKEPEAAPDEELELKELQKEREESRKWDDSDLV